MTSITYCCPALSVTPPTQLEQATASGIEDTLGLNTAAAPAEFGYHNPEADDLFDLNDNIFADPPPPEEPMGPEGEHHCPTDDDSDSDRELLQEMFAGLGLNPQDIQANPLASNATRLRHQEGGETAPNDVYEEHMNAESRRRNATFSKVAHSEYFEGASQVFGRGSTFLDKFANDCHTMERVESGMFISHLTVLKNGSSRTLSCGRTARWKRRTPSSRHSL